MLAVLAIPSRYGESRTYARGMKISIDPWSNKIFDGLSACQPDGNFQLFPEDFAYWSLPGFFQITLGYGELNFTQAKAIDIIWDVLVGRGGQAVVSYISFKVFAMYLTTNMEDRAVAFNTYRAIILQDQQSYIVAIFLMARDFITRMKLKSYTTMAFIITTMIFMLAFPTLSSAMTGYKPNVKSYVPDRAGTFIPFSHLRRVAYAIEDGWRINQTDLVHITFDQITNSDPIQVIDFSTKFYNVQCWDLTAKCTIVQQVHKYVGDHGVYGYRKESSSLLGINLPAPVLNITPHYRDNLWPSGPSDPISELWLWGNQTFDLDYIQTKGRCQPLDHYQWGFSFVQLNVMVIICLIWSLGIFYIWIRSRHTLRRQGRGEIPSDYKAIFELANAMHLQLVELGEEKGRGLISPSRDLVKTATIINENTRLKLAKRDLFPYTAITGSEIRRRISKDLKGGMISPKSFYDSSEEKSKQKRIHKIWRWCKKEKKWLLVLLGSTCAWIFLLWLVISSASTIFAAKVIVEGLLAATLIAICVGSISESKVRDKQSFTLLFSLTKEFIFFTCSLVQARAIKFIQSQ
ncbi:hypothetical protein B0J11DRAFT_588178 [Dendryphion nanum]|uniref:Uncharacterized protein n=1 Tax=Dendryphion nanum TaxID=256645 RepID=A0A9P9EJP2_9PLEO|nr:hypothetical protein B0J11DRAFT_588178 [Dendryphion nanum]